MSSIGWNELLGDDFSFEHVTENGTLVHQKTAFLAQLEYLSEHAVGWNIEQETQRGTVNAGSVLSSRLCA